MDMKVGIIIPTLNEEEHIGALIDSLNENTYENKEIIVADGGSTDRTIEIAKEKGAKVLVDEVGHRGLGYSKTQGAEHTDAEVLCFLNADMRIQDKYFLENCLKLFDDETGAVSVPLKTIRDTLIEKILSAGYEDERWLSFIRKDVFWGIGKYPMIGVGEDTVFEYKVKKYLKENNLKEKLATETSIFTHWVHSVKEMYKQAVWYSRTSPAFAKELIKEKILLRHLRFFLMLYAKALYFLSFLSIFLIPLSRGFLFTSIFTVPVITYILLKSIRLRNKYNLGKTVLFLIYGLGVLHGLFLFKKKQKPRKVKLNFMPGNLHQLLYPYPLGMAVDSIFSQSIPMVRGYNYFPLQLTVLSGNYFASC